MMPINSKSLIRTGETGNNIKDSGSADGGWLIQGNFIFMSASSESCHDPVCTRSTSNRIARIDSEFRRENLSTRVAFKFVTCFSSCLVL